MVNPKYAAVWAMISAGGDLGLAALGDQVLEHDLGQGQVDLLPVEAGEGGDPDQGALELADVGLDPAGDELQHVRPARTAGRRRPSCAGWRSGSRGRAAGRR